jgi:hypothetical protein
MSGLTISNGFISSNGGSGIDVYQGNLTADGIVLSGNTTTDPVNGGPGLLSDTGTVTIRNSAIVNNHSAGVGGGVYNFFGSNMTLVNTTISGNIAAGWDGGAIWSYSPLTLRNCTVTDNSAVSGSGIAVRSGTVSMSNTILAGNRSSGAGPDLSGQLLASGYNLIGNTQGGSGFVPTDILNVDLQLGKLGDNGGPTPTRALLPGSPAINAGTADSAPLTDQRGVGRGDVISIGAFQATAAQLALSGLPDHADTGQPLALTVTAQDPLGQTAVGYRGTITFSSSDDLAALPGDYPLTALDAGQHTFPVAFGSGGTQSVTATDTVDTTISGRSADVLVGPAAPALLVRGFPAAVTAGDPNTFTVTILDTSGHSDASYRGTVHFTSTDPRAFLPRDYSFTEADAGSHLFGAAFRTAGTQALTATDIHTGALTGTQNGIVVSPAEAHALVLSGLPSSLYAGDVTTFTVTVVDAFDNVVTGYGGTVHFSSTDAAALLPRDYTFTSDDAGSHTFAVVLMTAGRQTLTARDMLFPTLQGSQDVDVLDAPWPFPSDRRTRRHAEWPTMGTDDTTAGLPNSRSSDPRRTP